MSFVTGSLPFPFTEELVRARRGSRQKTPEQIRQEELERQREREAKLLASREARLKKQEEAFKRLRPVPRLTGKGNRFQRREEALARAQIIRSNTAILKSAGISLAPVGGLQRSAVRILRGEIAGPGKNASIQKQVQLSRLNESLVTGKINPKDFIKRRDSILKQTSELAQSERQFRARRSINKAEGEAAAFEEQRLIDLDNLQRQNRQSQIISTGRQNQRVFDTLESFGQSTDLTRATPRKAPRPEPVSNPSQRQFAFQQVNRPIDESANVLTSGQVNALDQQGSSIGKDTILNDFFERKSEIPVSQNLLVDNVSPQSPQQQQQGPQRSFQTVVPTITRDIFGFSVAGDFPSGVQQQEEVQQLGFTSTRGQFFTERAISRSLENLSEFGDSISDPIGKFGVGAIEELAGIGTSSANLISAGVREGANVLAPPSKKRPQEPGLFVAPTVTGEFIAGPIESAGKAFETGDPRDFFGGFEEGLKRAEKLRKEQGTARALGQFVAFAAPTLPAAGKVSPVRSVSTVLPLKTGEKKVATTITTFGQPVITRQGSEISRGGPKATRLPIDEISPVDRGLEISTGTSRTAQKTKQEIVDVLGERGLLSQTDVAKVKTVDEIVRFGSTAPKRTFSDNFGKNPFVELAPGRQTKAQLDFFRSEKLPPITGSFSQIPQVLPQFARRAGDFDIKIGSIERGAQLARRNVDVLQPTANPLEKFVAVKAKVKKVTPKGESKVGEFLTKEDELIGDGQGLTLDSVFGIKPDKKPIKVSGIKVTTLRDQLLRKATTVTALQGPASKGVVKSGLSIGPPEFRTKDITDLFAIGKTQAFVLRESGKKATAQKLEKATGRLKTLFPEIDFDAPFAKGETIQFGTQEPSILSNVASSTPKKGVTASSLIGSDTTTRTGSISSGIQIDDSLIASNRLPSVKISDIISDSASKKTRSSSSSLSKSIGIGTDIPAISSIGRTSSSSRSRPSSSSRSVSSIESFVPKSNISLSSPSSLGRSGTGKSSVTRSGTSKTRPVARSSTLAGLGEGILFTEPRIKAGLFQARIRKKAKLEDEAVVGIGTKQFRTGTADPLSPGVIASLGVRERIGKTSKVFGKLDKALVRSRKKRAKSGVFDLDKPFGNDLKF